MWKKLCHCVYPVVLTVGSDKDGNYFEIIRFNFDVYDSSGDEGVPRFDFMCV